MSPRNIHIVLMYVLATLTVACWPVLTIAQQAGEIAPPTPANTGKPKPWVGYLILVALAVVVISISLLPSKRSHQD